jgi:hypothetical protein
MPGIPPTIGTDTEDVAWALQTAEALWKRSERLDAIVWLRRAAQAAGDAEDDDRALALARGAAELAEWVDESGGTAGADATVETSVGADTEETPVAGDIVVDEEVPQDRGDPQNEGDPDDNVPTIAPPPIATDPDDAHQAATVAPPPLGDHHVPTAAEAHAGMLDPWAESEAPTIEKAVAPLPPRPPVPRPASIPAAARAPHREPTPPPPRTPDAHHEQPGLPPPARTPSVHHEPPPPRRPSVHHDAPSPPRPSVPHREPAAAPRAAAAPPEPPPRSPVPPPLPPPPPAPRPAAQEDDGVVTSAPSPQKTPSAPPAAQAAPPAVSPAPADPVPPSAGVDLANVEALGDLPDDAREAFAAAAKVQELGIDDEVSGFALALVLEGSVDLAATIVDTPAERLEPGAILRARGTIDHAAPVRLIGASEGARVATWDDDAVTRAFHSCPWVEDDLRTAADRYQALVGVTMGPLGERLDPSLRAIVTDRLNVRTLTEHEVCAAAGAPVVGLLVVGAGEIELLGEDGQPKGGVLSPGEFLFAAEALRAAPAPSTARAAKGGAIVLFADRNVTQELLVTCPPLLEIFAGM